MLFVEDTLAHSVGLRDSIVSTIAQIVDLFVFSRARVHVLCITLGVLNSKKRVECLGLKRVAPVPLCFDTLYLPRGERASGS